MKGGSDALGIVNVGHTLQGITAQDVEGENRMRWAKWLLKNPKVVQIVVALSLFREMSFLDQLVLYGWKWG
jgi:hypothetical protein